MDDIDFDAESVESKDSNYADPIILNIMDSELVYNQFCNSIKVPQTHLYSNCKSKDTHQALHNKPSIDNVRRRGNENFSRMFDSHAWDESKTLDEEINFDSMSDGLGANLCFSSEFLDTSEFSLPIADDLMDFLEQPQQMSQTFETLGNKEINNKLIPNSTDFLATLLTVGETDFMENDLLWGDIVKDLDTHFLSDDFVNTECKRFFDTESKNIFADLSTADNDNSAIDASVSNLKQPQETSGSTSESKNNSDNFDYECVIEIGTLSPQKSTERSPVPFNDKIEENSSQFLITSDSNEIHQKFAHLNTINHLDISGPETLADGAYVTVDNIHYAMYPPNASLSDSTERAVISKTQVHLDFSSAPQRNLQSYKNSSLISLQKSKTQKKSKTVKKVRATIEKPDSHAIPRKSKATKINEILNIKCQKSQVRRNPSSIRNTSPKERFSNASPISDQLMSDTAFQQTEEPECNSKNTTEMKKLIKPHQTKQSKTASIKVDKNGCLISLPKNNVNTLMVKDLLYMSGRKKKENIKDATEEYRRNILTIMQRKQLRLKQSRNY
ncbi:unnamed protein product [Lymnaea stagnalis]|uniref:Uncharacterized protein n=1 Tax=Lymnaea stagnalis TaxID=6523 RepID=A0AAV2H314_LYMST